jgi:NADH:ubiquinone oxidoreductase subunit
MLKFIKRLFAWWDGATLGALFDISRRARRVGQDQFGNVYFQERRSSLGDRPRRYVIYRGYADASRVPPDWYGWLHHTFAEPPTDVPLPRKPWEKEHVPNLTGTVYAYHPSGSLARPGPRAEASGDYESWTPS